MTASSGRGGEAGFTLIEVMVSLLIFGMIAAGGVAILSFSVRAQAATRKKLDDTAALERTVALLSADLGQATARVTRDEAGTPRPAFVGETGGAAILLTLVRQGWGNIDAQPRSGAQKVAWRLTGRTLERVGYPQLDGAAPMAAAAMLPGVRRVALRYRYRGAWSDRWDGAGNVPLPDALDLTIDREDGTRWRQVFLVGTGWAPPPPVPVPRSTPTSTSTGAAVATA